MADDTDPFTLVPPELRLSEKDALALEADRLVGQVRSGHIRARSAAYRRQWLERACLALEAFKNMQGKYPWGALNTTDMHATHNLRDRALATVRGEPEEPLFTGRPHSPTNDGSG